MDNVGDGSIWMEDNVKSYFTDMIYFKRIQDIGNGASIESVI